MEGFITITWSVFAIPSSLLFMMCFAPSRYESKLWVLKKKLENVNDSTYSAIGEEFKDLKLRYWEHTSGTFGRLLVALTQEKTRWDMLDERVRAAVDWELIRVQPIRYVWNETDHISLYGLAATIGFGFAYFKLIKRFPNHLLFFNVFNFALMFGNYKQASPDDKKKLD